MTKIKITTLLLLLGLVLLVGTAQAQDKTLYWQRYDVNIRVQENSDILVEEVQQIQFTSGTFRFGYAAIPLDRVERITDVTVSEIVDGSERAYTPNSTDPYGFTTAQNEGDLEITWYFPPTSNSQHTYILSYRVTGGLRIYDGGDQLWWKAIAPDHNFPISSTRVTVTLPQSFPQEQLTVASYGAEAQPGYTDQGQVLFQAENIPADEELEVRVQFPHGVVQGTAPSWQAAEDRQAKWGPVLGAVGGGLGLLLLLAGPVGLYLLWHTYGRDRPVASMPDYISEPPGDLPAGMVGTLVDEKADVEDIIASILDLARRGALRIEDEKKEGFLGIGSGLEHNFILENRDVARRPYEKRLIKRIFGKEKRCSLRSLRNSFYSAVPKLQKELYEEVVQAGYFPTSPQGIRSRWTGLGVTGLIVTGIVSCFALAMLGSYSELVVCPVAALIPTMVGLIIVGRHMPRKTAKGAEEAAKWMAFKEYLKTIEKHNDLEEVKHKFEQFLPYAVAFGLEKSFIRKFEAVNTPVPGWWGPHHRPYYHGPGRVGGEGAAPGGPPGPLAGEGGGAPSLAGMSQSVGSSLSSMSDSLGSLLSSASSTLTSRPASSSSGGGGGFSGGGFSGGGGGGGGSRGFG